MKFSRRYNHSDPYVNDAEAIRDIRQYLGEDRFRELFPIGQPGTPLTRLSTAKAWLRHINIVCSFSGIRGFPVQALKRAFFGQHPVTFFRASYSQNAAYERGNADVYYRRWLAPNRRLNLLAEKSFLLTPADIQHYRRGAAEQDDQKEWA